MAIEGCRAVCLDCVQTYLSGFDHENALEDPREVPQVEGIVGSGWCRQQLLADSQVDLNAALDHGLQQGSLHVQPKLVIHEAPQYGCEHHSKTYLAILICQCSFKALDVIPVLTSSVVLINLHAKEQ